MKTWDRRLDSKFTFDAVIASNAPPCSKSSSLCCAMLDLMLNFGVCDTKYDPT